MPSPTSVSQLSHTSTVFFATRASLDGFCVRSMIRKRAAISRVNSPKDRLPARLFHGASAQHLRILRCLRYPPGSAGSALGDAEILLCLFGALRPLLLKKTKPPRPCPTARASARSIRSARPPSRGSRTAPRRSRRGCSRSPHCARASARTPSDRRRDDGRKNVSPPVRGASTATYAAPRSSRTPSALALTVLEPARWRNSTSISSPRS